MKEFNSTTLPESLFSPRSQESFFPQILAKRSTPALTHMFSPPADPQILFKGCGISVNETKVPLPGKLGYVEDGESFPSEIKREGCAPKPIRINPIPSNIYPLKEVKHQDRSKINESAISSTKQAKGLLESTYIPSSPVVSQIVFEKWEIDVDDIEAPLPDPFDYTGDYKNPPGKIKQNKPIFKPPFIHPSSATISSFPRGVKHQGGSKVTRGLISTEQGKGLLNSIRIASPPVTPHIEFERWEIDVDDIEAPLPDSFDYARDYKNPPRQTKQKERISKPAPIHQNSTTISSLPQGVKYQDRSKITRGLISTEQVKDLLKQIHIPSPPVAPRIEFERWEIDVDDIEAPLPDPFNYVEAPVNRASGNKLLTVLLYFWDISIRILFSLLQTGHSEGVVEVYVFRTRLDICGIELTPTVKRKLVGRGGENEAGSRRSRKQTPRCTNHSRRASGKANGLGGEH